MMSVFCSKTLIFDPECLKCILRCLDFINFPGGGGVCPWTALETGVENRNIFTFFKAFATDLKPY